MVRYIQPKTRSFGKILADEFAHQARQGIQGLAQQQEMQQMQQQRQQQAEYLASIGIDPSILDQPQNLQGPLLKEALRPETWGEMARSFRPGATPRAGRLSPGMQQLRDGNMQQGEMQSQEVPSWLNTLGGIGTGAAAGAASRAINWKGEIADALAQGADYLNPDAFPQEIRQREIDYINQQQQSHDPNSEEYKYLQGRKEFFDQPNPFKPLLDWIPSAANIKEKVIKPVGEKVGLGELTGGKDPQAEMWGEIASTLTKPSNWTSPWNTAKDMLKSAGVAVGGDFAGHMAEKVSGSPLLGNLARFGTYIGYSMWPGSLQAMADQRLEGVNNTLRKAEQEGVKVNTKRFQHEFDNLGKRIDRLGADSESFKWLNQEAAHVQEMFANPNLNPVQLENSMREMSGRWAAAPEQAKHLHQELVKLQRKALGKTLDTVQKGSSRAINEAYNLLHTNHQISNQYKQIVSDMLPRGMGLGTMLYFAGGYPVVLAGAGARSMANYTKALMGNKVFTNTMKQMIQAQSKNNARLVQQLAPRLNKEAEKTLGKIKPGDREAVQNALMQIYQQGQ